MISHTNFYKVGDAALLFMIQGCWNAESTGGALNADLDAAQDTAILDIAEKVRDRSDAFAVGWESGRTLGQALPPGTYRVRVQLRAASVNVDHWFVLKNQGPGAGLTIEYDADRGGLDP